MGIYVMLIKQKPLKDIISNMKSLGNMLLPYTYPRSFSSLIDNDLDIFREREIYVDGYSLIVFYQKSDYGQYFIETIQIYNKTGPFLPFNIVFKIAVDFLGSEGLSLVEIFKSNKKLYCWSLATDPDGSLIDLPYEAEGENCVFDGVPYFYINSSYVNFY